VFTVGVACWLAYGVLTVDWPIILANLVTLLLAGSILAMRLAFASGAAPKA
jgi:MtN3 and saliva related transmembrane protein